MEIIRFFVCNVIKFVDRYNANIRNIKKELLNHFFIREYESIERTRPNK